MNRHLFGALITLGLGLAQPALAQVAAKKKLSVSEDQCAALLSVIEDNRAADYQVATGYLVNILRSHGLAQQEALMLAELIRDPRNRKFDARQIIESYEKLRTVLRASGGEVAAPVNLLPNSQTGIERETLLSRIDFMRKSPYDGVKNLLALTLRDNSGLLYPEALALATMLRAPQFRDMNTEQVIARFERMRAAVRTSTDGPVSLFEILRSAESGRSSGL